MHSLSMGRLHEYVRGVRLTSGFSAEFEISLSNFHPLSPLSPHYTLTFTGV
jgi:hypothetical protein